MPESNTEVPALVVTRRTVLGGLGALMVGIHLPLTASAASGAVDPASTEVNAFVFVGGDGTVTIRIPVSEMGQGVSTALPQCVADELDCDWSAVRVEHAPEGNPYKAILAGPIRMQLTGGSSSIQNWRKRMRTAGATARSMLVMAAAAKWGVPQGECQTKLGVVSHASGKQATYGELAAAAATQKAPKSVTLKPRSQWRYIGKPVPRLDNTSKVDGSAVFGTDIRLPNMLRATVVACPVFGGTVASVDESAARAISGVRDVVVFDSFVAVVADTWWPAKKGADALKIQWNEGPNAAVSSAQISANLRAGLRDVKAYKAEKHGDAAKRLAVATDVLDVSYEVPFLEHATMEPMSCTAHVTADRAEVWGGVQGQTMAANRVKKLTGLRADQIHINTTMLGGGFGRRGLTDFVEQAVQISMRVNAPIQLMWTRQETMQHGFYRPAFAARYWASTEGGKLDALRTRVAGPNLLESVLPKLAHGLPPVKRFPLEGIHGATPYHIENSLMEWAEVDYPIPVGFWRSVGHSHNGFFIESVMDEVAHKLGQDPVAFRRGLLQKNPRFTRVLDKATSEAGWGSAPQGRSQGVAIMGCYGSVCAAIVELSMEEGLPKLHKVTAAVDCGPVINPDIVEAQIMGGFLFGLSAALGGKITIEGGRVVQNNFHDYRLLRMFEAPDVDVHIVENESAKIGGIGEVSTPLAAPALCNAIFAATGQRIRTLPIVDTLAKEGA